MPGGSGLLDQLCERFGEIVQAAHDVVDNCPAVCGSSCIDCLQTFRNAYYHPSLDRAVARECLDDWGRGLSLKHDIPPLQPAAAPSEHAVPVNDAEVKLRHLLLAAGFGEGVRAEQIRLDRSLGTNRRSAASGTTTPDVIYRTEDHDSDEGVCIYLDGLSEHLHGNPETAERDREFRTWLRNRGYEVIEIAANELDDERRHGAPLPATGELPGDARREEQGPGRPFVVSRAGGYACAAHAPSPAPGDTRRRGTLRQLRAAGAVASRGGVVRRSARHPR